MKNLELQNYDVLVLNAEEKCELKGSTDIPRFFKKVFGTISPSK